MASMNHARELSIRDSKSFADCRTHDEAFDGVVDAMNHEDADPTGLMGSSCSFVPAQPPSTKFTLPHGRWQLIMVNSRNSIPILHIGWGNPRT